MSSIEEDPDAAWKAAMDQAYTELGGDMQRFLNDAAYHDSVYHRAYEIFDSSDFAPELIMKVLMASRPLPPPVLTELGL